MMEALGLVELNSVAAGIETGDQMLKVAAVELAVAQPVCPGKFVVMVRGDVAAVSSAVDTGEETAGENFVDSLVIPNVHHQVFAAVACTAEVPEQGAIGVLETFSLAACIYAADAAVKAANVELIEIRLGRGLGGKAYMILTGDVSAVSEAIRVGKSHPECAGMIARSVVIPSPHPDIREALI